MTPRRKVARLPEEGDGDEPGVLDISTRVALAFLQLPPEWTDQQKQHWHLAAAERLSRMVGIWPTGWGSSR